MRPAWVSQRHCVGFTFKMVYIKVHSAEQPFNDKLRADAKRRLVRVLEDMPTGKLVSLVSHIQLIVCGVLAVHVHPRDGSDCDRDRCVLAFKFFPKFLHRDLAAMHFSTWRCFEERRCASAARA